MYIMGGGATTQSMGYGGNGQCGNGQWTPFDFSNYVFGFIHPSTLCILCAMGAMGNAQQFSQPTMGKMGNADTRVESAERLGSSWLVRYFPYIETFPWIFLEISTNLGKVPRHCLDIPPICCLIRLGQKCVSPC